MPETQPQPFYTSKSFWVLLVTFILNLLTLTHVINTNTPVETVSNGVLAVLALVFRWTANQPLALPGPGVAKQ